MLPCVHMCMVSDWKVFLYFKIAILLVIPPVLIKCICSLITFFFCNFDGIRLYFFVSWSNLLHVFRYSTSLDTRIHTVRILVVTVAVWCNGDSPRSGCSLGLWHSGHVQSDVSIAAICIDWRACAPDPEVKLTLLNRDTKHQILFISIQTIFLTSQSVQITSCGKHDSSPRKKTKQPQSTLIQVVDMQSQVVQFVLQKTGIQRR